ncbi:WSC-domain-containing protein [Apiospora saccharicola]
MSSYKPALALAAITLVTRVSAWYPNLPRCTDAYTPFTPLGCYANGQDGQPGALMERMDMDAYNMTIEACTGTCKGNGFTYAALGWIGSCYCGQTINRPTVDSGLCNLKCSGNNAQTCGGTSSVMVYKDTTFPDITTQTTDAYTSLGCYTDDGTKPVFFRQDAVPSNNLTTKACLQSCLTGGFPYAATEFGGECYCGVVLGKGVSSVDSSQCNMACNGASGEKCGGRNRQNVYLAKPLACTQPCGYKPPTAATTSLVTYIVSPMPSTVAASSTISSVASSEAVDIPSSSPVCEKGYGYGGCAPTAPTVAESSPASTIASSEAVTAPSSAPIVSTPSPLPESTSSPVCENGLGYGGCAPTAPTVAESSPISTVASSEAVTAPSSTPIVSTSSPLPESSSTPVVCENGYGYGGCAPTAPTVAESSSTIASTEAVSVPSSTPVTSTIASSEAVTVPESTSSPACENGYGYGGCAPTAPTVAESSSTITSSEAVSVPSSTPIISTIASSEAVSTPSSTPIVGTSSPLPESSSAPVCEYGYGHDCAPNTPVQVASVSSAAAESVPSPSTSTSTFSPYVAPPFTVPSSAPSTSTSTFSPYVAPPFTIPSSAAVVTPSTSTSSYIVSTSATLPASSPTTSTLVTHIASSSATPSTYAVVTPSTPIKVISSTLAVTTPTPIVSTPIVKIPSTTPLTTLKISTTCDFGCGKFCYALPEWTDSKGCAGAWSHCMVNVASCYLKAGIPDALNCNGFAQWCGKIQEYCKASPAGNKDSYTKAWPPVQPTSKPELKTKTMTVPCATVATPTKPAAVSSAAAVSKPSAVSKPPVLTKAAPVTTTLTTMPPSKPTGVCPIPTPTGLCQQPKNTKYGYDVSTPVGGIKLPSLTCNNLEMEHKAGHIFKLYTDEDTRKCASFTKPQCASGCSQACRAQYDQCVSVYAEGCRTKGKYNGKSFGQGYAKGHFVGSSPAPARHWLRTADASVAAGAVSFADSYDSAKTKCTQQFRDCQDVNKRAVSEKCKIYGIFS